MLLIGILGLGAVMSFLAVRSSFYPLKLMAGFTWLGVMAYWINADMLTDGSPADTIIMMVLLMAGLLFLIWGIGSRTPRRDVEEQYSSTGRLLNRIVKSTRSTKEPESTSMMAESNLDYRNKVRKALNRGSARRRK